jgi:squalene synthase HpnC
VTIDHYENFPVASLALPSSLRRPIRAIYAFARAADDIADEGNENADERLAKLNQFEAELDCIESGMAPDNKLFFELAEAIREHKLPLSAFRDLLSAFRQDVIKTRYADFGEVMDYCRRSANPVGRLLMNLFRDSHTRHLAYSDALCSSLQLINFLQDVSIDYSKGRIYLPQDELARAGLSDAQLGRLSGQSLPSDEAAPMTMQMLGSIPVVSAITSPEERWRQFMHGQIRRVQKMLQASAPLGMVLKGRAGFETRMTIAGGDRILRKLYNDPLAPFKRRIKLNRRDWLILITRALLKK